MKVVFHEAYYPVYAGDPAAAAGRMEAIMDALDPELAIVEPDPATEEQIAAVHTPAHIERVKRSGVFEVASLAAGGAIRAAEIGLSEPCFGLIRPPGHHASADSAWGFCYFNNMAIALAHLHKTGKIESGYVLDIDLHYGDGTAAILGESDWAAVYNVAAVGRSAYLLKVKDEMEICKADVIGISAGFDNHQDDWGGTLATEDYRQIGRMVKTAAERCGAGYFALLEGGYNHRVLGQNVNALIEGMAGADAPF
jgi:acetoin utilization deacetylase AcuC-like enzyme